MQEINISSTLRVRVARDLVRADLNRPDSRNALTIDLLQHLIGAIRAHSQSVVCIGGVGPAFCSGLDLREIRTRRSARRHLELLIDLYESISHHPAPVVTCINGPARGGGAALAWCSDLAIVSRSADFAIPWMPGYRPLARALLPLVADRRNVNRNELPLGETFTAGRALKLGLIDRVVGGKPSNVEVVRSMLKMCDLLRGMRPPRVDRDVFREMRRLARATSKPPARAALLDYLDRRFGKA